MLAKRFLASRQISLNSSLTEKKAKSTARYLIEGEWISVDDATDNSGAELSVIGRRIVTRLQSLGVDLNLSTLEATAELFSACGSPFACDAMLEISRMTFCFDDGPKTVFRNVKSLESSGVDDLLLARSFLDTAGFTLADFLKMNSGRLQGLDESHDVAIADYVTSGAAGEGSFSRFARLASIGACARYEYITVSPVSDVCVDFNTRGETFLFSLKLCVCLCLPLLPCHLPEPYREPRAHAVNAGGKELKVKAFPRF